jgi:hypothetical protein
MSKITLAVVFSLLIVAPSAGVRAQSGPPVRGTIALEGTMQKLYRGMNIIVVTTMDGVEHAYRFTRDLIVHGGKSPEADPLEGLREGSTVVIHYTSDAAGTLATEIDRVGEQGLHVTEGRVTRLDRGHKQIAIAYDNGTTEMFQLTDLAASEAENEEARTTVGPGRVVIYYRDENGRKVVHFFRRIS